MELRPYQLAAVNAIYEGLRSRDDGLLCVLPTGAGKSLVIAQVASDASERWNGRTLILAHRRELLQQNADKLQRLNPRLRVGVYSAGLKRRDTEHPVLVAGIQSIWKRACEFDPFDLVLVDECHLIDTEEEGMYATFLSDARQVNPQLRVIGFTATPFRLKTGSICTPDGFLNHICYEVGVRALIRDGYLCPLITKAAVHKVDTEGLHVRGGEFVTSEVEALMDQDERVVAACREIVECTADRKAVLIFATGIPHGEHVVSVLKEQHGIDSTLITGLTPSAQREELLTQFLHGRLKYLVNVNVLTTGFDAPNVDCVVLLRPTMSPGLLVQMVGRGFRLHPSKANCLVLDFGGNVLRHGPIDQIKIRANAAGGNGQAAAKVCEQCQAVVAIGYACCPECGFSFPPPDRKSVAPHESKASTAGILAGQVSTTKYAVRAIYYSVHKKRGASEEDPKSMRVNYRIGFNDYQSEWVCLEHGGFARHKAELWWQRRSRFPLPETAQEAVQIAQSGGLAFTTSITVRAVAGEEFVRIIDAELGPLPEGPEPELSGRDDEYGADAFDFSFGANAPDSETEIPF